MALLDAKRSGAIVFGRWMSSKSELRTVMTGKYAGSFDGPCGPVSLSAGSQPANWASTSDSEIAKIVAKDGAMPVFLEAPANGVVALSDAPSVAVPTPAARLSDVAPAVESPLVDSA